ncbi:MAG TPA: hypothetical protein VNK95_24410 [Caldilineaceae bacterium]|nr:hypothetical protein [Caldilineaceae bacterium]
MVGEAPALLVTRRWGCNAHKATVHREPNREGGAAATAPPPAGLNLPSDRLLATIDQLSV